MNKPLEKRTTNPWQRGKSSERQWTKQEWDKKMLPQIIPALKEQYEAKAAQEQD
jgi:hypothetical protein